MKVSKRRASLGFIHWATSNPLTSPAICELRPEASNREIVVIPLWPAVICFQAVAGSFPTGEMIPKPVTTTRRLLSSAPKMRDSYETSSPTSGLDVCFDVVNCLLDRGDFFGFVVGNLGFKGIFECHDEFDRIE